MKRRNTAAIVTCRSSWRPSARSAGPASVLSGSRRDVGWQPVGGGGGCLGGAPGPLILVYHVLSRGKINLQVSFAIEGLLRPLLSIESLGCFVQGKLETVFCVQGGLARLRDAQSMGEQIHPAMMMILAAFPSKTAQAVWSEQSYLLGLCKSAKSLALMHLSMCMLYKTQLALPCNDVVWHVFWSSRTTSNFQTGGKRTVAHKHHVFAYSWLLCAGSTLFPT